MDKALLITIGAVLRRVGIALGVGVLTYLIDAWPQQLKQALESDPTTAAWIPAIWIFVEAIQKLIRERSR